jgi:ribosomal protein L29
MNEEIKKIDKRIEESKEELRKLRFSNSMGQLTDVSKIAKTRKIIAREKTNISKLKTAKA